MALENRVAWLESFLRRLQLANDGERDEALRSVAFQDRLFDNPLKEPQPPSERRTGTETETETAKSSALRLGPYGELITYLKPVF
jgi:hypothetical protein